jgi:hypothetical protein
MNRKILDSFGLEAQYYYNVNDPHIDLQVHCKCLSRYTRHVIGPRTVKIVMKKEEQRILIRQHALVYRKNRSIEWDKNGTAMKMKREPTV